MTRSVLLREVTLSDLALFYEQQLDPEALYMAAFTVKDPENKAAFLAHWAKVLDDETIALRTILVGEKVAGHIVSHRWFSEPEISYWLGREYWGQGIATMALSAFLLEVTDRPLYARAAKDNQASIRVLEKCGFKQTGEDKGFSNARNHEVEEYIFTLA